MCLSSHRQEQQSPVGELLASKVERNFVAIVLSEIDCHWFVVLFAHRTPHACIKILSPLRHPDTENLPQKEIRLSAET